MMSSVAIMMMFATQQVTQAINRQCLRPSLFAMIPAVAALTKAPKVIKDDISCCRSVVMFHPVGMTEVGTG
jgi:hypothetical protein